jgi:hypothetical protein
MWQMGMPPGQDPNDAAAGESAQMLRKETEVSGAAHRNQEHEDEQSRSGKEEEGSIESRRKAQSAR